MTKKNLAFRRLIFGYNLKRKLQKKISCEPRVHAWSNRSFWLLSRTRSYKCETKRMIQDKTLTR